MLITPPAAQPLDIAAVRQHLRVDITDDDSLISGIYLPAAVDDAQSRTCKQLVAARHVVQMSQFPLGKAFLLPVGPLIQLVSISYLDQAGIAQNLPLSDVVVDVFGNSPRLTPARGKSWPYALDNNASITITFDAGYAAPMVADATANSVAVSGWKTLAINDAVRFSNSGGALPAPFQPKTDYYIRSVVSPGVYTLSAAVGGALLDITNAGSGTHYLGQALIGNEGGEIPAPIKNWLLLNIETQYSHRGRIVNTMGKVTNNEFVDGLLTPYLVYLL
jgi:uncharacterized phiE125 gp8 family phage protein